MEWTTVKKKKIKFTDQNKYYQTIDGELITWGSRDAMKAQRWLSNNKSNIKVTPPSPPGSGKIFNNPELNRKEFKRSPEDLREHNSYVLDQLDRAEKDHDFSFPMSMKVKGLEHESNWFTVTRSELQNLKKLFSIR